MKRTMMHHNFIIEELVTPEQAVSIGDTVGCCSIISRIFYEAKRQGKLEDKSVISRFTGLMAYSLTFGMMQGIRTERQKSKKRCQRMLAELDKAVSCSQYSEAFEIISDLKRNLEHRIDSIK